MAKSISLLFIGRIENSRSLYLISKTAHRKCRLRPRNGKSQFQRVLLKSAFSLRNSRILAQQFVRLDDTAFTVAFMGINDPAPTITRDCAAVAPRPTCRLRKISDQLWCRVLSNQLEVNKAAQQVVANNPQNCSLKSSLGCPRAGINFVN